jgi:hypothetical protein
MKIIHKIDRKIFKNSGSCDAFEYGLDDKDLSGTVVEIRGRYPESGYAVNLECKEMAYILEGSGTLSASENETEFATGDLLLQEKYFWNGNFTAFLSCNPAWSIKQHEIIE